MDLTLTTRAGIHREIPNIGWQTPAKRKHFGFNPLRVPTFYPSVPPVQLLSVILISVKGVVEVPHHGLMMCSCEGGASVGERLFHDWVVHILLGWHGGSFGRLEDLMLCADQRTTLGFAYKHSFVNEAYIRCLQAS